MQAIRINNRILPQQVFRIAKASAPTPASVSYNTTRTMSFFPRFIENEFAPARDLWRLMDDYANHVNSARGNGTGAGHFGGSLQKTFRSFTPKFDVKETKESYELHGELPGIEQQNISVEFTDAQTLTIKGRTEHTREEGTKPGQQKQLDGEAEQQGQLTESGEGNDAAGGYHKPSVEDDEVQMSSGDSDAQQQPSVQVTTASEQQAPKQESSRYWVSERSVGEFARTFSFPTRVDQDNVRASLKDGVLSIVVPKAQVPTSRRINIE